MGRIGFSAVVLLIVLLCELGLAQGQGYPQYRRHGRPARGFARQTMGHFQDTGWTEQLPSQSNYPPFNHLEYGGVPPEFPRDSDEDIQQVSRNDGFSDFSQQQSNLEDDDVPLPPRYVQTTTSPTTARPVSSTSAPASSASPEAVTPKGTFVGKRDVVDGKGVYIFYGVPYAKPPINKLRFQRPVPYEPTEEVMDATKMPPACPQTAPDVFNGFSGEAMWTPKGNTSEDCLFLNIWVPESAFNEKEETTVPVFFWIYGGGFFSGSNNLEVYNGARLAASQGMIVVSVQYRLGPLGFLYLEPGQGNYGLFDQSLGLQWTHKNIEYFGGNPDLITIAGESAGAASVGFHLLSPLSKGYIKRGMMTSGLPIDNAYALNSCDQARQNSYELAKDVGCNQQNFAEIMECLRNADVNKLVTNQWKNYKHMTDFPFAPVVDGTFLPDHPQTLLMGGKAKRADLLLGTVEDEGSFFILYHYINYLSHAKPTSVTYDRFVEIMSELFYDYNELEREAIIDMYTHWENPEDGYANQRNIAAAAGDAMFVCPHRKFANGWSIRGLGVYYYHLTQRFSSNPWAEWMGVLHGDDIPLLFGPPADWTLTENEKLMVQNFQQMVGNFARKGVPSTNWERYSKENPVYLDVNATIVSDTTTPDHHGPHAEACAFWNKLLPAIGAASECLVNPGHASGGMSPPQTCGNFNPQSGPSNIPSRPQSQQPLYYVPVFSSPPQDIPHQQPVTHSNPQYQQCSHQPLQTTEPPVLTSTSTSCKCTVEEGPTSSTPLQASSPGFGSPPPARY